MYVFYSFFNLKPWLSLYLSLSLLLFLCLALSLRSLTPLSRLRRALRETTVTPGEGTVVKRISIGRSSSLNWRELIRLTMLFWHVKSGGCTWMSRGASSMRLTPGSKTNDSRTLDERGRRVAVGLGVSRGWDGGRTWKTSKRECRKEGDEREKGKRERTGVGREKKLCVLEKERDCG